MASSYERPDQAALARLEPLVHALAEELSAWRKRCQRAETELEVAPEQLRVHAVGAHATVGPLHQVALLVEHGDGRCYRASTFRCKLEQLRRLGRLAGCDLGRVDAVGLGLVAAGGEYHHGAFAGRGWRIRITDQAHGPQASRRRLGHVREVDFRHLRTGPP